MKYRSLGLTNEKVSVLGQGTKSNLKALELTLSKEDQQLIDSFFPKTNEGLSLIKY